MFSFIKNLIAVSMAVIFTYAYYGHFYKNAPCLLAILCASGAIIALCFSAPKTKSKLLMVFRLFLPFIVLYTFTYNFIFALFSLLASLIISVFIPQQRKYTKILFDEENKPFVITYKKNVKLFPHIRGIFSAIITLVFALGFIFFRPSPIWLTRAFPIDYTQKAALSGNVIPSGIVTSTVWYDDNALSIAAFFDIDDAYPSPGEKAGLKQGDIVTKINGERALGSDFITKGADENPAKLTVKRQEADGTLTELSFLVTPIYSEKEQRYLIGITYYSTAAISASVQTMTFSYPDTGYFAATAHSSDDLYDTMEDLKGLLMYSLAEGRDSEGLIAIPKDIIGEILYSDDYGCYGVATVPGSEALPIARKKDFRIGKATLLSAFEGGDVKEYEVHIIGTYRIDGRDVMYLIASDPNLKKHGGITRGMSGSPIIQQGKLIGALSNMDSGGYSAYATFACDMAHQIYLNLDKLQSE